MSTLPIQTTDEARAFLVTWMRRYFPTDRTFGPYIMEHLAGDFAFQLANALAVPVSGSAGDALEAAAQLVIQRTAVPRDLLGPATAQMKAKAAAGEQMAAAIRTLRPAANHAATSPAERAAPDSDYIDLLEEVRSALLYDQTGGLLESVERGLKEARGQRVPARAEAKPLAHGHRDDYHLMANARRLLDGSHQDRRPNWAIASDLFATGATSARQICYDAGIDPDGVTVERKVFGVAGIDFVLSPAMAPGTVRMQSGQHSVTAVNVAPPRGVRATVDALIEKHLGPAPDVCPSCNNVGWPDGKGGLMQCPTCDLQPLTRCAAGRDGECGHAQCPQLRDGEPAKSGRHCPLDS